MRGPGKLTSRRRTEDYLITESPEKKLGQSTNWAKRLSAFPALQNQNYRIYFFGQFVSVIGTWLQIVAQGWLVLQLTNSPFLIGLVAALATVPSLLFSLIGGVVVDRFSRKRILFITQSASMVLAFILGTLTVMQLATVPLICIVAFLMGTVNAVDAPARQAFISELVSKDQLPSAIALNSGIFNSGRVIGPGLAGLLIAFAGTGGAFIVNGISYLAVIIALAFLKINEKPVAQLVNPMQAIKQGISYSYTHPVIRALLLYTAMVSIFGWSYTTIMPVIARDTFNVDAKGLGYLYSATGVGSLFATFLVGAYAKKIPAILFIVGGNMLFCVSLVLFSFTDKMSVALPLLFFTGFGLLAQAAMMNTIIQGIVKAEFRGRVMSIYILMFLGLAPFGNFEIGWLTEHLGVSWAISINSTIVFISGMVVYTYQKAILRAYRNYKRLNPQDVLI